METRIEKDNIYNTPAQLDVRRELAALFEGGPWSTADKLSAFVKYVTRQDLSLLLARFEIFKRILPVKGSVVECGVYYGNGLMTWAQLSASLEPTNYNRRILGFDTFAGNAGASKKDAPSSTDREQGEPPADYAVDSQQDLVAAAKTYDANRFLNHIPKIELIRGDITETVPGYLRDNPHLMVSLLSLSVNLHRPTEVALRHLLPRMCRGSIVALHTLNEAVFPGVTLALLERLDIGNKPVLSFAYAPNLAYVVL